MKIENLIRESANYFNSKTQSICQSYPNLPVLFQAAVAGITIYYASSFFFKRKVTIQQEMPPSLISTLPSVAPTPAISSSSVQLPLQSLFEDPRIATDERIKIFVSDPRVIEHFRDLLS